MSRKVEYLKFREDARMLVHSRLIYFNQLYNLKWGRLAIRDQRTRWGSCSRKGNLNFNYRIVHLPAHLRDYIIVHELCHLKHMNHAKDFWALMAQTIQNPLSLRKELSKIKFSK